MVQTARDLIDEATDHPSNVRETATALATRDEMWAAGKAPRGIAAAAIYVAYTVERPFAEVGNGRPTQMEVAEEFDTSAVTLRKRLDHLRAAAEAEYGGME